MFNFLFENGKRYQIYVRYKAAFYDSAFTLAILLFLILTRKITGNKSMRDCAQFYFNCLFKNCKGTKNLGVLTSTYFHISKKNIMTHNLL